MSVRVIETIDTHTLGEPTRIVLNGFPRLAGRSLAERSRDLLRRHDAYRRALMLEPRGHAMMFGAVVVPPVTRGAGVGLVFMDGGGAVHMCLHGTMGAVTALIETGRLKAGRDGAVLVDTPAGAVRVRVHRIAGRVTAVDLEGVPARSVATGLCARVGDRDVAYDLADAGNLIAIVSGEALGLKVTAHSFSVLRDAGVELKRRAQVSRPDVVSALIYSKLAPGRYRDLVVFRDFSVDRSPCGSCFAALMAHLHATRKLRAGEWVECENLLGLAFRGRLIERGGELIPELSGSAFITGEHRFHIDSRDPLREGFQLA
ncbi:MAG TPA: proline racemase family protein [Candidatus Dormibacteraeota bacterium]|nr:proline racemase family protein [Candidatus Dormibacteraeota bacterium]